MTNDIRHQTRNSTNPLSVPGEARAQRGGSTRAERWLMEKLHALCGRPPVEIRLWDGASVGPSTEKGAIEIRDRSALFRLLRQPEVAFGDLYSSGRLTVHGDLTQVLYLLMDAMGRRAGDTPRLLRWLWKDRGPRGSNEAAARGNIQHHYDLGNDFYSLWLDRAAMQYTCAYFESPDHTLEQAQLAKLEHVCRKLRLEPGQTVIEAGCGWGGLARYMARQYGVRVRAYNISREQLAFAREKAQEEGLQDRVEYIEDDYRNISGRCDRFVSVGMLEHVGPRNYRALAQVMRRSLHPEGLGLIHTIGRNKPAPLNGWTQKRIFPGAYVPSVAELMQLFEAGPFSVLDVENLRLHYARTLDHWLARFRAHRTEVVHRYDEAFARAWELYLAASSATFRSSGLQLFQVVFAPAGNNTLPNDRRDLYCQPAAPKDA